MRVLKKESRFDHAGDNYEVYAYLNDGSVRVLDMKPMIEQGGIFQALEDQTVFREALTVMNHSVAWDLGGNRDEGNCIDVDPFRVYECPIVADIPMEL
ncbi:MAG: DUF2442 domain-containing protein [Clostridiales bacterium]|nr:DUF2442 domain-containing protein [Clostridiales bacterium]